MAHITNEQPDCKSGCSFCFALLRFVLFCSGRLQICRNVRIISFLFQLVDGQSAPQFRLEPCRFRRHDIPGIGDVNYLFH